MEPVVDVNAIKEIENLRMLWGLAVWFIGVSWPLLTGLIIFFYFRGEKFRERELEEKSKEIDSYKEIIKDKLKGL